MCEHTYVGCPHCGEPAESDVVWYEERTSVEHANLDAEGNIVDYGDSDYGEPHDSGYKCLTCERTFSELDTECTRDEECECRECDPETAVLEPEDDETVVLLRRTNHDKRPELDSDTPPEVIELFSDRAVSVVPVRARRAAEIVTEELLPHSHAEVDLYTNVPMHLREAA